MKKLISLLTIAFLFLSFNSIKAQDKSAYANTSLSIEERIADMVKRMTLEEKLQMIGGFNEFYIKPLERLNIPLIKMSDGPVGVRNYGNSTAYPASIALASTWNIDLAYKYGQAIGKEAKAKDVNIMLGPAVNIHRAPMCGRNFEYLGEDPFLAGKIAAADVKGMQSEGVMATVKHYAANNQEYDRYNVSSDMEERTLQEIYLPAFKACVQEGKVACVMTSYNLINGVHASQNNHLINEILKKDWGFEGIVMSDWGSTYDGAAAAKGGLDLEMPSGAHMNVDTLKLAIKTGKVSEEVINDKISRMLRQYFRFNLMENKVPSKVNLDMEEVNKVALETSREGMVLLKNQDNILPLNENKIKSIVVIGQNAHPAVTGGGGSSKINPLKEISILDGITQTAGKDTKVSYLDVVPSSRWIRFNERSDFDFLHCINDKGKVVKGLKGEYFDNPELIGKPVYNQIDTNMEFYWDTNSPAPNVPKDNFSVRWTGTIISPETGTYELGVISDDKSRLYFEDKMLVDNWRPYEMNVMKTCKVKMEKGKEYKIKMEFADSIEYAGIRLRLKRVMSDEDSKNKIVEAKKSDLVILCLGFNDDDEGEGVDRPYRLPDEQIKLIKDVYNINKNIIVVLNAGGNAGIADWIGNTKALLHAWYPGQEGGKAIAEILFGKVNPSGKLPISIEKRWEDNATFKSYYDEDKDKKVFYSEGVFLGYRHFDKDNIKPLFPFGYGLSYTSFNYDNIKVNKQIFSKDETVEVTIHVTNKGQFDGSETVQLYVRDKESSEPRPVKELKGFDKKLLKKGEGKDFKITLNKDAFSFFSSKQNKWIEEAGKFEIMVGSSSDDIKLKAEIELMN